MHVLTALRTHTAKLRIRTPMRRVSGSHLSGDCSTPQEQTHCCGYGGNQTANFRGCVKWKEAKAAISKQTPDCGRRASPMPPCRSESQSGRPQCRGDGPGRGVESRSPWWACCQGHYPIIPIPNPLSQSVTDASEQPKVTATRKMARPQKSEPKTTAAPKLAAGMSH